MGISAFGESGGLEPRRLGTLALVGLLMVSAVGGVVGSSGIAAAQQGGSGGNGTTTTAGNASDQKAGNNTTITKDEWRQWFTKLEQMVAEERMSALEEEVKTHRRMVGIFARVYKEAADSSAPVDELIDTIENRPRYVVNSLQQAVGDGKIPVPDDAIKDPEKPGVPGSPEKPSGPTSNQSVNRVIAEFEEQGLGYKRLSKQNKTKVQDILLKLSRKNVSQNATDTLIKRLGGVFAPGATTPNDQLQRQRRNIIATQLNVRREPPDPLPNIKIKLPNLLGGKLAAFGDKFKKGAADILTDLYNLAFTTPVPENSGWNGVLGTPVDTKDNQVFYTLFQTLLVGKLYPVTYSLLTVAIVFMAISMAGNPFMSHHQVVNYFIKLFLAIMYWAFAWTGVTLMHGVVNEITKWIRPSPEVMGQLVTNVEALSAGAVAAYFAGSSGILATLFTLSVELGMRRVLVLYVFPYIFPVLLLVLYLSPWQRLRGYASMAIWQYVNVLTMVIPIAVLLKAAAVVSLDLEGKPSVVAMAILVALFVVAAAIPVITTYFYIQMPGTAKKVAKKGMSGAWDRLGTAKDKMGWGGDGSASDSTATSGNSPGENTDEAVAAALDSRPGSAGSESRSSTSTSQKASTESSGLASSGTVDSTPDTTAGWVRELHDQESRDPMNDDAVLEAFSENRPARTTMNHKLGD